MAYIFKKNLGSEQIDSELQRQSENRSKEQEQILNSEEEIVVNRINEKFNLDFPYGELSSKLIDVMNKIFRNSDIIHADVMLDIFKDMSEIDTENIFKDPSDIELCLNDYNSRIIDIIEDNIKSLLYFNEHLIFATRVFQKCKEYDSEYNYLESDLNWSIEMCDVRNFYESMSND